MQLLSTPQHIHRTMPNVKGVLMNDGGRVGLVASPWTAGCVWMGRTAPLARISSRVFHILQVFLRLGRAVRVAPPPESGASSSCGSWRSACPVPPAPRARRPAVPSTTSTTLSRWPSLMGRGHSLCLTRRYAGYCSWPPRTGWMK